MVGNPISKIYAGYPHLNKSIAWENVSMILVLTIEKFKLELEEI